MKIAIIGCGNMGLAYARSFLKYNLVIRENLLLIEKNEERKTQVETYALGNVTAKIDAKISAYDIVIIAVKPQDFSGIKDDLKKSLSPGNILLSIMAGITLASLEEQLNHKVVVRAMPNTPAQLGMGVTAFASGSEVSLQQVRKVENILGSTGKTVFLEDEKLLDAVTALSGSGPAYFFYIVKAMIEAGVRMGLEEPVASLLVKQTMQGSFHLLNNATQTLDELIKAVSSKGGTTEAAFHSFEEGRFTEILIKGIREAEKRAGELSKG